MKITTVNYQKSFVTGPFLQEKIGMEIQIEENESPDEALSLAKEIAETWHKANNPQLEGMTIADVPVIKQERFDIDEEISAMQDEQFAKAIDAVEKIAFKEDALTWMNNNGWTYNIELKNIANSKPSKNA